MPAPGGNERNWVFRGDGRAAPASPLWGLPAHPAGHHPADRRLAWAGSELQKKSERWNGGLQPITESRAPRCFPSGPEKGPFQSRSSQFFFCSSWKVRPAILISTLGRALGSNRKVPGFRSCKSWQGPCEHVSERARCKDFGVTPMSLEIKTVQGRSQTIK